VNDEVTTEDIHNLYERPDTVLVVEAADGGPGFRTRIVTPAEMTRDQCAVYRTSWGEPDENGLSAAVRSYLTHTEIRRWLREDQPEHVWQQAADEATSQAYVTYEVWRRGDDVLADELFDDPTAWAKYVT
jgi:hypothetical protein